MTCSLLDFVGSLWNSESALHTPGKNRTTNPMDPFLVKVVRLMDAGASHPAAAERSATRLAERPPATTKHEQGSASQMLPFDLIFRSSNEDLMCRVARSVRINIEKAGIRRGAGVGAEGLHQLWAESESDPVLRSIMVVSAHGVIEGMQNPQK